MFGLKESAHLVGRKLLESIEPVSGWPGFPGTARRPTVPFRRELNLHPMSWSNGVVVTGTLEGATSVWGRQLQNGPDLELSPVLQVMQAFADAADWFVFCLKLEIYSYCHILLCAFICDNVSVFVEVLFLLRVGDLYFFTPPRGGRTHQNQCALGCTTSKKPLVFSTTMLFWCQMPTVSKTSLFAQLHGPSYRIQNTDICNVKNVW